MKVVKIGGSILKNVSDILRVKDLIQNHFIDNSIIIFSAFFGCTNSLLLISRMSYNGDIYYIDEFEKFKKTHIELLDGLGLEHFIVEEFFNCLYNDLNLIFNNRKLTNRNLDKILSYGELISSRIISEYLNYNGLTNSYLDIRSVLKTNDCFGCAKVNLKLSGILLDKFSVQNKLTITQGFIASTLNGATTTLGRNGSDITACVVGNILNVERIFIIKDVNAIMTADPKIIGDAERLENINYIEAATMSALGSKVIHIDAIKYAMGKMIDIYICSFHEVNSGTIINDMPSKTKSITLLNDVCMIKISFTNKPHITSLLDILHEVERNIIFYNLGTHDIKILVHNEHYESLLNTIKMYINSLPVQEIALCFMEDVCAISLIGKDFGMNVSEALSIDFMHETMNYNDISTTYIVRQSDKTTILNLLHNDLKI